MVKKSRRNIYDPALNPNVDEELISSSSNNFTDYEGEGVFKENQYHDDPLYFQDDHSVDEERQTTEILDPNLHNLQRRGGARRKSCYFLACCGALVTIITMSVLIKKSKTNKAAAVTFTSAALVAPSSDLAAICSPDSIASPGGRFECQQACVPSKCCDYPANLALSCLAGNEDTCQIYHRSCGILTSPSQVTNSNVPPAPANLNQICSMQSLVSPSGLKQCAEICMPQKCCYSATGSRCATDANCMGYSACHNLDAHDNIREDIAFEVNAKCQNPALKEQCQEVCLTAMCCFNPFGTCSYKADQDGFCRQYDGCKTVWNDANQATLEPTMSDSGSFEPTPGPTFDATTIDTQLAATDEPTFSPSFMQDEVTDEPTTFMQAGVTDEPTYLSTFVDDDLATEEPTTIMQGAATDEPTFAPTIMDDDLTTEEPTTFMQGGATDEPTFSPSLF